MNINEISTEQLEQELAKRKEAKDPSTALAYPCLTTFKLLI